MYQALINFTFKLPLHYLNIIRRFHLGQSWWWQIQSVGLAKEYKLNGSDISKWLHHFFGLAFLRPEDVGDSFAEDLIPFPDMPNDKRVETFADYVLSTYIEDSALFPPSVWAEIPSTARRTNNGPEAFHAHYNEVFCVAPICVCLFW